MPLVHGLFVNGTKFLTPLRVDRQGIVNRRDATIDFKCSLCVIVNNEPVHEVNKVASLLLNMSFHWFEIDATP